MVVNGESIEGGQAEEEEKEERCRPTFVLPVCYSFFSTCDIHPVEEVVKRKMPRTG